MHHFTAGHTAMVRSFLLIALAVVAAEACFLGGGGGGGGGGCGCPPPPCAPPPPPSCGCGRKKRSVDLPEFPELSGTSEDALCNSPRLRNILIENMSSDVVESKKTISGATQLLNEPFVVICSSSVVSFATSQDTEFCSHTRDGIFCEIFSN